ncbi:MAG: hypothetical protein KUG77_29645 [Nannocystaceae bacterium]|nr:hypothetical protein [Nannocystaceae bacterium]
MSDQEANLLPSQGTQASATTSAPRSFAVAFLCPLALLTACGPSVDPPPLMIQECAGDDSPTELARFDYDPEVRSFEPFDLGHALTVRIDHGLGESQHYIVDNCGGTPLRLERTFGQRPGAIRVGGDIVLCTGAPDEPEGIWELLEDGSPGEDLGIGYACPDRLFSSNFRTGISPYGFVFAEDGDAQHLVDGRVRPLPVRGTFFRVNDTWLVHSREGQVAMLGPDGADPVVLDLPDLITDVFSPPDSSPWVVLSPDFEEQDAGRLYALDTRDGSWFTTSLVPRLLDPNRVAVRDGLAITRSPVYASVEFTRARWDASLRTDLDVDAGFTVLDDEHVLIVNDRDVRLLRIPLDFPDENETAYEVLWKYPVPNGESLAGSYPGMLWQDVVLLPLLGETWAFPIDGSEPYPFLPLHLDSIYFGSEFITGMVRGTANGDDTRFFRRRLGGEFEVIAEGVLDFQDRPWTPELGRILYAVRDGEHVSIRQHRLTD